MVDIEPGKTLIVKRLSISPASAEGIRRVYFELNGTPRHASVRDTSIKATVKERRKAEEGDPHHLGATMPGVVADTRAKKGAEVKKGDVLLVLEAMKMQVNVTSPGDHVIAEVPVESGDTVNTGDLLVVFE